MVVITGLLTGRCNAAGAAVTVVAAGAGWDNDKGLIWFFTIVLVSELGWG